MASLLDWCAARTPHPDWPTLMALDYATEGDRLRSWAIDLFAKEPPAGDVDALYFGLFNPVDAGEESADIYLAGAPRSTPNWVARVRRHWWPSERCSRSPLLAHMYRIAYAESGLQNSAEYPIALGFTALAAAAIGRTAGRELLAGSAGGRWIAAGFDSGDVLELGRVSTQGFETTLTWV